MSTPFPGWHALPSTPSVLPVVPREYHEFYRTPSRRWWRPLLALLGFVLVWVVVATVIVLTATGVDLASGQVTPEELLEQRVTPTLFLANNLTLAAAIPLAFLAHWAASGQRPRWLSSIAGGFRWTLFLRFALLALPAYLVTVIVEGLVTDSWSGLEIGRDTAFLILTVVLTTPFQAAGEEFAIRGFLARVVGSWFPARRVGMVVAAAVGSLTFAGLHLAADPWLNAFYLLVGVTMSILVWRTGGLEAAVALHVVNNLLSLMIVPFTGLDGIFDRGAGAGDPWVLLPAGAVVVSAALMLWQARRLRLTSATAPGAPPRPTMVRSDDGRGTSGPGFPTTEGVR